VNRHELDAAVAAGAGIGEGAEIFESGVERGTGEVLLALREFVEESPEEVEVSAGGIVHAAAAAERAPELLNERSYRRNGKSGADVRYRGECVENALGSL
jgi:hypothetical protein